jgi:hypothetical protein
LWNEAKAMFDLLLQLLKKQIEHGRAAFFFFFTTPFFFLRRSALFLFLAALLFCTAPFFLRPAVLRGFVDEVLQLRFGSVGWFGFGSAAVRRRSRRAGRASPEDPACTPRTMREQLLHRRGLSAYPSEPALALLGKGVPEHGAASQPSSTRS